ncbi:hypothetical protein ACHAW6_007287 [Cyclotella cf. meneghiniana]
MSELKKACPGSRRQDYLPTNFLPVALMQTGTTNADSHRASGTTNDAPSCSAL